MSDADALTFSAVDPSEDRPITPSAEAEPASHISQAPSESGRDIDLSSALLQPALSPTAPSPLQTQADSSPPEPLSQIPTPTSDGAVTNNPIQASKDHSNPSYPRNSFFTLPTTAPTPVAPASHNRISSSTVITGDGATGTLLSASSVVAEPSRESIAASDSTQPPVLPARGRSTSAADSAKTAATASSGAALGVCGTAGKGETRSSRSASSCGSGGGSGGRQGNSEDGELGADEGSEGAGSGSGRDGGGDAGSERGSSSGSMNGGGLGAKPPVPPPCGRLTYFGWWFEDVESSDLTFRIDSKPQAGGGLAPRHCSLTYDFESATFIFTMRDPVTPPAPGQPYERIPELMVPGLSGDSVAVTDTGRPANVWDLHLGARLRVLGRQVVLKNADLATAQWHAGYYKQLNALRDKLAQEVQKYKPRQLRPGLVMDKGDVRLAGGQRLHHVALQVREMIEDLRRYRPAKAEKLMAALPIQL